MNYSTTNYWKRLAEQTSSNCIYQKKSEDDILSLCLSHPYFFSCFVRFFFQLFFFFIVFSSFIFIVFSFFYSKIQRTARAKCLFFRCKCECFFLAVWILLDAARVFYDTKKLQWVNNQGKTFISFNEIILKLLYSAPLGILWNESGIHTL